MITKYPSGVVASLKLTMKEALVEKFKIKKGLSSKHQNELRLVSHIS